MKVKRIVGHKINCDRRSCHPQHEGCHSEIYFTDDEIIWDYEILEDRSIKLRDIFPDLYKADINNLSKEFITGVEFGYIYCPICEEKLYYGTRELYLTLIKNAMSLPDSDEKKVLLAEALEYYKGNLFTPFKDLLEKDDIKRGQREASVFVSYTYGDFEDFN